MVSLKTRKRAERHPSSSTITHRQLTTQNSSSVQFQPLYYVKKVLELFRPQEKFWDFMTLMRTQR